MGNPDEDSRFENLHKLHSYLESTFPGVHSTFSREKIATYGLVYTWKGADATLKPIVRATAFSTVETQADLRVSQVLMAHQGTKEVKISVLLY